MSSTHDHSFSGLRLATLVAALTLTALTLDRDAFAEDAAILTAPQELHAGGRSSLTLVTLDSATRAPISREATIELRRGGVVVAELFRGTTDADGRVSVPFTVPSSPGGSGGYSIEARVVGVDDVLELDTSLSHAPAILIETDKPIYKPSQKILGRVLLVDNSLRPTSGEAQLSIHDGKGIRIHREAISTNEFGVAPFSLDIAREVNYGVWKIKVRIDDVESVRDVRVEPYVLPRYDLGVSFTKSWALPDESVEGTVNARYFFGRDVEGVATVVAKKYVAEWEEYGRAEGTLSDGEFSFTLPPSGFVAGTAENGGQGTVTIDVEVVDSTGHKQTVSEILTVPQAPVVLRVAPRGQTLKPEMPLDLVVTASTPEGVPVDQSADVSVTFYGIWGQDISTHEETLEITGGVGELTVVPPKESAYAEVNVSGEREGRTARAEIQIGGAHSEAGGFLSLFRSDLAGDVAVDVGSTLSLSTISTDSGTVYYEVYAGGRSVLSEFSETRDFSFVVTAEMAPTAKVVAYTIHPSTEVAADSLVFRVNPASTISVDASFDRETVRPGEDVSVTIDAGTGERSLLGVSVVDESVLALGRSRLHLSQVFAELESRFLEPLVEVHEGHGGPEHDDVGRGRNGAPRTTGALDVFHGAGLKIVTSQNLVVPQGIDPDEFWGPEVDADADDFDEDGRGDAGEEPSGGGDAVRVRQYFPETWVWEPLLITDDDGRASLDLTAPDSITGWKLSAISSSSAGIGFGEAELTAFQEFFVEPSLPYDVTRGEEFPVKVDIFNYLDEAQEVSLEFGGDGENADDWYELLGENAATVEVPAGSATSVSFPIRPTRVGMHRVEVTAIGSRMSDAVSRTIIVVPEGLPAELVDNQVIEAGQTHDIDVSFPEEIVTDSSRAFLHITPSPVAQTMNGISQLLQMPFGCGEQNMIFLAPDIEILKYLREVGELNPEIRAQAELFVNTGYQRELTFQTDDGGFAAFGGENGSLWLTAFVLSTFAGAREVRDIDENVLAQAAAMLVSRQLPDGSFQTDDFLIHKEMDGGLENLYAMTAYVTNALADYAVGPAADGSGADPSVLAAMGRAAAYLRDRRSMVENEPYSLSIAAVALLEIDGFRDTATSILDRLLDLAIDEGVGIHWEPYPVETTGYVAMALLDANYPQAGMAVDWLSTTRNSLGGYGESTQDTVVAIPAHLNAAPTAAPAADLDISVLSGDEVIATLHIDSGNYDVLHTVELPLTSSSREGDPEGGDGGIRLRTSGTGTTSYQVVRRFNLPGLNVPPARDIRIDVDYDSEGIEVDEIVDVTVRLLYTGAKNETGMVIADIGIPTGFTVLRTTLDSLVESGSVSRAEVAGRKAIFYLDSLIRDLPVEFTFQIKARFPVRAEGPLSRVYEYYDTKVEAYHTAPIVAVLRGETEEVEFTRGDSNRDDNVDVSDAVASLEYLFQGGTAMLCADAADINDDGQLDITDAIRLLGYLFQGGPSPAEPFPDPGFDASDDELDCLAVR